MKALPVVILTLCCAAIARPSKSESIPFTSERWQVAAEKSERTTYLGRECLMIQGGMATLDDVSLADCVIEFDIAFPHQRGFTGVVWHMQDAANYEHFYVRPHQSGYPDANQYNPVFNGVSGWQLYHGPRYGTGVDYDYDSWISIKIVVKGTQAEAYIQDMEKPALFIAELKRGAGAGAVGVNASHFAPAYFSRFSVTDASSVSLRGAPAAPEPETAGMIDTWMISAPFDEARLEGVSRLDSNAFATLEWSHLAIEAPGFVNMARVCAFGEKTNTAFARLVVDSDREQGKLFRFGYSDRARVYLNGQLLYAGDNGYQTRDYRFLGTIGLFDGLYLPLVKGRNELWIAVSENFGGWGVMGRFAEMEGISLPSSH